MQQQQVPKQNVTIVNVPFKEQRTKVITVQDKKQVKKRVKLEDFVKNLKFTDIKIFGERFSALKDDAKCAADALVHNGYLNSKGNIKKNRLSKVSKRYMWQYIAYIRAFNKNLKIFKPLGKGGIKPEKLYLLIKLSDREKIKTRSVSKEELKSFLNKIFREYDRLNLPWMKGYEEKKVKTKTVYPSKKIDITLITEKTNKVSTNENAQNSDVKITF